MATLKFKLNNQLKVDVEFWKQGFRDRIFAVPAGRKSSKIFDYHGGDQIRIHVRPTDQTIQLPRRMEFGECIKCKTEKSGHEDSWLVKVNFIRGKGDSGEGDSTTNVTVTGDEN